MFSCVVRVHVKKLPILYTKRSRFISYYQLSTKKGPKIYFPLFSTKATTAQCPFRVSRNRFLRVFKDHCYEFNVGGQLSRTWPDAEKNCQEKGGHLVSISSLEEQNFIFKSLAVGMFRSLWMRSFVDEEIVNIIILLVILDQITLGLNY